jgi:hypothetical protein
MPDRQPTPGRRTLLGGAATVGVAAAAAALLPSQPVPPAPVAATPPAPGQPAGGYQLTEHVKQYYASARI